MHRHHYGREVRRLAERARETAELAAEQAEELEKRARGMGRPLRRRAEWAGHEARGAVHDVERFARRRPVATAAIAIAAGAAIAAALLNSRR